MSKLQTPLHALRSRRLLLAGASLVTLLAAQPATAQVLSSIRPTVSGAGASSGNGVAGPRLAPPGVTSQQAAIKAQQSVRDFNAASSAVIQKLADQARARVVGPLAPANGGPAVPNGLGAGGLAPAAAIGGDRLLWQNAKAPTQAVGPDGKTTVTIDQTAQKAILTWDSFNVGAQTTVHFDQTGGAQSDGSNNWIALNRIIDPNLKPSTIQGQIKAEGSVYLINRNGVVFATGSQVDTHSLVASSLSFLGEKIDRLTPGSVAYDQAVANSNLTFLTTGIAGPEATGGPALAQGNLVLGEGGRITVNSASDYQVPGDIRIEAGATISTHQAGSQGDGGLILIAAPKVSNAGVITASDGQTILAAGIGLSFWPSSVPGNHLIQAALTGQLVTQSGSVLTDVTPISTLTNTGLVLSPRGYITMLGANVVQNGVVAVTTGISYPGGITITAEDEAFASDQLNFAVAPPPSHRGGLLSFGAGSVTANLPEEDDETATSSPTTVFKPGSIALLGSSVWFENGSLLEAPGAKVTVAASAPTGQTGRAEGFANPAAGNNAVAGRILVDNGATIDVAGLANVELPISSTLVTIPIITANEIADDPNQQYLLGLQNILIDGSLGGTTADGRSWLGTPILNANGYVLQAPRRIDQLLVNAGSITLSGNEVLTAAGSTLDLDGGYVSYQGGSVATTRLVDSTGHIVSIGNANPNAVYVGIAGQTTVVHGRWGVTDVWSNSVITSAGGYQPGYIAGGNAGTLTVFGNHAVVLDGDLSAQAFAGAKQIVAGVAPSGAASGGSFRPVGGVFDLGDGSNLAFLPGSNPGGLIGKVIIQDAAPKLTDYDPDFSIGTAFDGAALGALSPTDPRNIELWKTLPADMISAGGFATVKIVEDKIQGKGLTVAEGATLSVQPGGSITANVSGAITVLGDLVATSGTISLSSLAGDVTVGPNALLSVAGQWVNDSDLISAPGANAFVNGGSITLATADAGSRIDVGGLSSPIIDASGSILLERGSVVDVSSGGVLLAGGLLSKDGVPVGKGGNLALLTYYSPIGQFGDIADGGSILPASQPTHGQIVMDGTLQSAGFSGGGKLTLQGLGFQIGGDPAKASAWDLVLPTDFFANQGFGSYQLNAMYGATVAEGATVQLTQRNLIANLPALGQARSGADLNAGGLTSLGTIDPYHRQATNLTITAGGYLSWVNTDLGAPPHPQYDGVTGAVTVGQGASIVADAGASIALGSPFQVTVLGSITAPGGSIKLTADTSTNYALAGMPQGGFTTPGKSVWLGANAVLDVSGATLINPFAKPVNIGGALQVPTVGKVLDGGSVVLSNDTGYVVAEAGSRIDVSGVSAVLDGLQSGPNGKLVHGPQQVWSDAGSIVLAASDGLFFDGAIVAKGGAEAAQGGMLTLLPEAGFGPVSTTFGGITANSPGANGLLIQQSGNLVPGGLTPGQAIIDSAQGTIAFSVDRLDGSGISTLVLGGSSIYGSLGLHPTPIAFAGDVSLSLANALVLTTSRIEALAAGATTIPSLSAGDISVGGTSVSIRAPYVAINGPLALNGAPRPVVAAALGDGVFNVDAAFIDLANQISFANFGQTNLTSSGDIRLSSVNIDASTGKALAPGFLYTPGDLTLKAADIYPASGETFILDAVGPRPTTITILGNGPSSAPLSAGGSLLIDADNIVQSGTLRAPFGNIVLGVNDPANADTQAAFDTLPLTQTQSVKLADGSLTSVSADNAILPYGATVDGLTWIYNPGKAANAASLSAPPAKSISLNGVNVALDKGGLVDLSGGGDLQGAEWVPGTGGSRDVLSQSNTDYSKGGDGVSTPLYADARNVYAIIPGYAAPATAYDPVFAQQNAAAQLAVGQAGSGDAVGKSVYLSGVPGLPAGVYTLLPAKYATLPGAYRVVANTAAGVVAPGRSQTLLDGTSYVSGYFVDAFDGSHSATSSQFQVQSAAVWKKYSQYALTSANSFFAGQAALAGSATPPLPKDAGQLILAATGGISFGSTLNTQAGAGGVRAGIDIASQDIQIVGKGEAALDGYIQISASDLNALNAGSLLIGGSRTHTTKGVSILVDANSVVVSNDAANPLTGPEILLVAKSDPTGTDPNAANGLHVESGSVITATGTLPALADQPITLGDATHSGDGALLRVSNGGQVKITRTQVGTHPQGLLTVDAGATINGGAALTLDSSGALHFDPAANFSGDEIAIDAPLITITNNANGAGHGGFVVGPNGLAQFANSRQVDLRSFGDIVFDGDLNLTFGQAVEFSAGNFVGDGVVSIAGPTIAFANDLGALTSASRAGAGSLSVNATQIDLGQGAKTLSGFATVAINASGGVVGQGAGSFDMGSAAVTLAAPVYLASTGSATSLTTTGLLTLNGNGGAALTLAPVGGAISFTGGTINDNGATIKAPAGNVTLAATSGDLTLASGSLVSSAGVSKTFFDITQYAPGGAIKLTADKGDVNVQSGSTLDFSGGQGGGAAGSLTLSASEQAVQLSGTIKGAAAAGYLGGSLTLDTGGAVDLDNLATQLASSGVNDAIQVQAGAGNLVLSAGQTLKAHVVSLTADGGAGGQDLGAGNVQVLGTIDASGNKGGEIDLYGKSGVDLEGALIATGSSATERGGTVRIGTVGRPDTLGGVVQIDQTYGYELVSSANSGAITLGTNAQIDVSGGLAGGLAGGTVSFRAPLLDTGDVNLTIAASARIKGSRATTLEAFAVWSTDDPLALINGSSKHFDGVVDPAGWYGDSVAGAGQPGLVAGTWADQSGAALPDPSAEQLADYLANYYFTPTTANADHQSFYGYLNGDPAQGAGALMGFVENFPIAAATTARFSNIENFAVTPGIELDNPDAAINDGNIAVLTNWNLGAGASPTDLAYRLNGQAPVITFKAENDVKVNASLTDGFFQIGNPVSPAISQNVFAPDPTDFGTVNDLYGATPAGPYSNFLDYYGEHGPKPQYAGVAVAPTQITGADPAEIAEYNALYAAYANFLLKPTSLISGNINAFVISTRIHIGPPSVVGPTPPTAAQQAKNPGLYLIYLSAYEDYLNSNFPAPGMPLSPLAAPIAEPVTPIVPGTPAGGGSIVTVSVPALADNTPSPMAIASNPSPLLSASLTGGASSSYRIIAGADFASADFSTLRPTSTSGSGGSVTIDGHVGFIDAFKHTIETPTMIRTGVGAIDIAAANDVTLLDAVAPGAIYTAGAPANGAPIGSGASLLAGNTSGPDLLVTNVVHPDAAGDISIRAGNDINGIENFDQSSGSLSQFYWQWMQTGNTAVSGVISQSSINFGAFDQGIMSVGGDVSIAAGRNISNLAVSLPTTWYLTNNNTTVTTIGGGDLTVGAGGDILSGSYFVAKGVGALNAGGQIASSGVMAAAGLATAPVSTILATQDGVFNVSGRQGVDIGAAVNPSYLQDDRTLVIGYHTRADSQSYSAASALNVISTTGDVAFNSFTDLGLIGALAGRLGDGAAILPANLNLTAFSGGITIERGGLLYPSATGQLNLIADQSIDIYGSAAYATFGGTSRYFGMLDALAANLPSPLNPMPTSGPIDPFGDNPTNNAPINHTPTPLHADDTQPVRLYSLNGGITDGLLETSGQNSGLYDFLLTITVDKPAQIYAGADITNLAFVGENMRDDDITRIVAGRDILDSPNLIQGNGGVFQITPSLQIGGVGTFDVEAGRNIGPLTPSGADATGIVAIGNSANPFLPHQSADVQVLYGVAPGVANTVFTAAYVDPSVATQGMQQALIAFMEQYDAGHGVDTGLLKDRPSIILTLDQAWAEFQALPIVTQQIFNQKALFIVMTDVGADYNNPSSPFFHQYARGYQALNTLFPAALGYTANSLSGGAQGAQTLVSTGNLDIRNTTIQTQQGGTGWTDPGRPDADPNDNVQKLANGVSLTQGGNVMILGPGGQALIGSESAPPATGKAAATQGILTLETGDVQIFTDTSLLLAQSRIFTEQGGAITVWSSNGDVNAGKGAKTNVDLPAPIYVCSADFYCARDARGEVSGAGISNVPTIPGVTPSNVELIAPRGTVDFGAAGVRVSGNLIVAAQFVANAANVQVEGQTIGVPTNDVNVGANLSASSTAAAAAQEAVQSMQQARRNDQPSVITVTIEGFGLGDDGCDPSGEKCSHP